MKKLFLTMIALTAAAVSFAQSSVLATLSHDGEISTFYGATALKEALNAAKHGDVITLSSGSFQSASITKAVTIRGAGMQTDSIAKTYPTVIDGSVTIDIADSLEQRLTVEGVYCRNDVVVFHTLSNATFIKTRFYNFLSRWNSSYGSSNGIGYMKNVTFIHCKISDTFTNTTTGSANNVFFVNSIIMNPRIGNVNYNNSSYEFTNCVVRLSYYETKQYSVYYATFRNSVLYDSNSQKLATSNLIYNCLGVGTGGIFSNHGSLAGSTYYQTTALSNVFKTWNGTYSEDQDYSLTEDARKKYPGDDEKELGIYGGNLPFTPNPTNPQITKFNVASKSTADGKLSVDIEVKAAE